MASRSQKQMLEAGATAPPFRLQDASGKTHSLAEILSRGPALLAFFKITCPVCQLAFPFFERMSAGGGLQFVGVQLHAETSLARSAKDPPGFLQREDTGLTKNVGEPGQPVIFDGR